MFNHPPSVGANFREHVWEIQEIHRETELLCERVKFLQVLAWFLRRLDQCERWCGEDCEMAGVLLPILQVGFCR